MLEIDLNAPTIPLDQRVWRLFPGESYQFLESFREQNLGFLDLPGLELPDGSLEQAPDFIPRIARSQAIQDAISKVGIENLPNFPLEDFTKARNSSYRGSIRSAIINFFEHARQNDIVILPEPVYNRKVWVGRFGNRRAYSGFYERRYGKIHIPARSITWLGGYAENTISTALSLSLRQTHPFTLIERSLFVEVFSLAYGSFVYDGRHVSTIYNHKDDYLDADSALLGTVSRLAAAACRAMDLKQDGLGPHDIMNVIFANPPLEYTCSQSMDVHSQGFNRYESGKIVAVVIAATLAALITLGNLNSKQTVASEADQINIVNSSATPDQDCTAQVSEATKRILSTLGIDKTWALCQSAKAAQARAGLQPSARSAGQPPSKKH